MEGFVNKGSEAHLRVVSKPAIDMPTPERLQAAEARLAQRQRAREKVALESQVGLTTSFSFFCPLNCCKISFHYLDKKFLSEINTGESIQVYSRMWEIIIANYLLKNCKDVFHRDEGFDWKIILNNDHSYYVEAVCAIIPTQILKFLKLFLMLRIKESIIRILRF